MSCHRQWLHQAGICSTHIIGQRYNTALGHNDLLGHAPIQGNAVNHSRTQAAQVIVTLHAHITVPAGRNRFQGDSAAVRQGASHLVANGCRHVETCTDHMQV